MMILLTSEFIETASMISRRLLPLFALVLSALMLPPRSVQGGGLDDESLVGILATAVSPKMAEQLRLTEEQLSALQAVIKERESLGLSLAAQLRELPPKNGNSSNVNSFAIGKRRLCEAQLSTTNRPAANEDLEARSSQFG